jgi:uncharacterized membrane protein YczE
MGFINILIGLHFYLGEISIILNLLLILLIWLYFAKKYPKIFKIILAIFVIIYGVLWFDVAWDLLGLPI